MSESATPVPSPNPIQENPEPAPSVPPKEPNAPQAPGASKARTTNGSTMPMIQIGCVQAWTLARAPIPRKTIGMTIRVVIR